MGHKSGANDNVHGFLDCNYLGKINWKVDHVVLLLREESIDAQFINFEYIVVQILQFVILYTAHVYEIQT